MHDHRRLRNSFVDSIATLTTLTTVRAAAIGRITRACVDIKIIPVALPIRVIWVHRIKLICIRHAHSRFFDTKGVAQHAAHAIVEERIVIQSLFRK